MVTIFPFRGDAVGPNSFDFYQARLRGIFILRCEHFRGWIASHVRMSTPAFRTWAGHPQQSESELAGMAIIPIDGYQPGLSIGCDACGF
jgi:hypothetical protein